MDYKYTELDYARDIYENGLISEQHQATELRLAATYMRRILDYKPQKLREEMYQWAEQHIPGYKKELYYKPINQAINKACKKGSILINIPQVDFYGCEINFINDLNIVRDTDTTEVSEYAYACKKLLFTLLFKAKMNTMIANAKGLDADEASAAKYFKGGQRQYTQLKKMANLPPKVKINEDIIHTLWINDLVSPMHNGLVKLTFIDDIFNIQKRNMHHNAVPVLTITDYDNVGWYFDYYNKDKKISFCKNCGRIFKKKSNRQVCCCDECSIQMNRNLTRQRMQNARTQTYV